MSQPSLIQMSPVFCEYAGGPCDQSFEGVSQTELFFLFPSQPAIISKTIEEGIRLIQSNAPDMRLMSWRAMGAIGNLVFCQVCKTLRFSSVAVTDVTTLNFNLMFEIGYAFGLGLPVVPIRDVSYAVDRKQFDELGLLDTFGYLDFQNSTDLAEKLPPVAASARTTFHQNYPINEEQPCYIMKGPIVTEGVIKLMSAMKKSGLRFRTFDPKETSRLSLQDALKETQTSLGVVAHLLAPQRVGATVHNARCAFVAGLAMATGKYVLMLQEGEVTQPIDYRDVIQSYTDPTDVQPLVVPFIKLLFEKMQSKRFVPITLPLKPLEHLDFGDIAAENEIAALREYFVPTAQYNDVKRGHARLVVGRKGAGKTAIFYGVRNAYWTSNSNIVLDLKPEGHQFTKLREAVLKPLSQGLQEHVLTAFWNYVLLMELAHKIIENDKRLAVPSRDANRARLYRRLIEIYGADPYVEQGDFSERLLTLVDKITESHGTMDELKRSTQVTELIYARDIKQLYETLSAYLQKLDGVWLLIDNLDKGWPVNGAQPEDILILRSLLEATRKLQRQFAKNELGFNVVVFIRNDIYDHLLNQTPDKGKDTAVVLEWSDAEAFQEIIHRRIISSTGHKEPFDQLWAAFFDTHVQGEESFSYILNRTLMRPRDLLRFLRECVSVAVNRNHDKVLERDILQAEKTYSEDQLQEVSFELQDISSEFPDVLYGFIGAPVTLSTKDIEQRLSSSGIQEKDMTKVFQLLLWFGFLGILDRAAEERFSYQYHYGVERMLKEANTAPVFVIHPAFRTALGCETRV